MTPRQIIEELVALRYRAQALDIREFCTRWDAAWAAARAYLAVPEAGPVAWINRADLEETLPNDGWCVVHESGCDPGSDHSADIPLYTKP
jgi:hypothetical protein